MPLATAYPFAESPDASRASSEEHDSNTESSAGRDFDWKDFAAKLKEYPTNSEGRFPCPLTHLGCPSAGFGKKCDLQRHLFGRRDRALKPACPGLAKAPPVPPDLVLGNTRNFKKNKSFSSSLLAKYSNMANRRVNQISSQSRAVAAIPTKSSPSLRPKSRVSDKSSSPRRTSRSPQTPDSRKQSGSPEERVTSSPSPGHRTGAEAIAGSPAVCEDEATMRRKEHELKMQILDADLAASQVTVMARRAELAFWRQKVAQLMAKSS